MKRILAISFLFSALVGWGQQLEQFTQYQFNQYAYNPAVAGSKPYWEVISNNRYQWVGITDAPRTYTISVNGPTRWDKVGGGGYIYTDIVGPTRRIGAQLGTSYQLDINEDIKLNFGLSFGLNQWLVDGSKIILKNNSDQVLSQGLQSAIVPDAKAGLYLYQDEKWYFGVSAPQLLQSKLIFFDYQNSTESRLEDHYMVNGGYQFEIGDDFKIEPSFMFKYVKPAPMKLDIAARVIYQDMLWLGGAFRTNDAFTAMLGYVHDDNLMLGYSYDFTTTDLKNYSFGTHEIMLGIKFKRSTAKGKKSDEAAMLN
jgi:type IX secretion system PorP/SprF family membrane protein